MCYQAHFFFVRLPYYVSQVWLGTTRRVPLSTVGAAPQVALLSYGNAIYACYTLSFLIW